MEGRVVSQRCAQTSCPAPSTVMAREPLEGAWRRLQEYPEGGQPRTPGRCSTSVWPATSSPDSRAKLMLKEVTEVLEDTFTSRHVSALFSDKSRKVKMKRNKMPKVKRDDIYVNYSY